MKIVYSWEWGAGAGHLRRFSPLANHLRGCSHEVVIVSREIASLPKLFPSGSFPWLQSPDAGRSLTPRAKPICLADLAFNLGFDSTEKIAATFGVWKQILGSIQPDLLIADFGIASLAVASAMGIPTARIGTGYTCPPFGDACLPMEDVDGLDEQGDSFAAARNSSQELLQAIHIALNSVGLSDQVDWRNLLPAPDRTLLATLPPLDPYRSYRSQSEYLGVWQPDGETKPEWSQSNRGRVVAYLKPFRWLPELLRMLASMGLETILYGDGIPESLIAPVRGPLLKVSSHPLNFSNIGDRCTFAICNANHGTTSKLLSESVPVLAIPLYLEQRLTGNAIQRAGLGVSIDPQRPDTFRVAIDAVMDRDKKVNAIGYANEFRGYTQGGLERAIAKVDCLLKST